MLDLLIRGAEVVDGTGAAARRADVGVAGGRIVAVGTVDDLAREVVDATGLQVTPGFIDMHAHSDLAVLRDRAHVAKVGQGITTEVMGQDGLSYAPVDDTTLGEVAAQIVAWHGPLDVPATWRSVGGYLDTIDREGAAVNVAMLVPHGTLRLFVMGSERRAPTPAEMMEMKAVLRRGMEEGAVGMSAGLTYAPGMYATDDELVELCTVVAAMGGYYCPHHRGYGRHAIDEYAACIEIGRRSGCAVHLTHCLLPFPENRGRAPELLALLAAARRDGVDVTIDTYPYTAGNTYLHAFLPGWFVEGGAEATLARLRSTEMRQRARVDVEVTGSDSWHGMPIDWSTVVVSSVTLPEHAGMVGQSVATLAATAEQPAFELACDLVLAERLGAACFTLLGNEDALRATLTDPGHMVGTDGILAGDRPHPRSYGAFPRFLGRYARDAGLVVWERAVAAMTSLPARRLGLRDRGVVAPGWAADLVVLDPRSLLDTATYDDSRRRPDGVEWVVVNGVPVVAGGRRTDACPGRSIRRQQRSAGLLDGHRGGSGRPPSQPGIQAL